MEWYEALILGIVQGLTEFLPISSSGHLEIASYILKTNDYMQVIGKNLGYDYVLSYRIGGPMLNANPNLNITSKVIDLLNKKYQTNN